MNICWNEFLQLYSVSVVHFFEVEIVCLYKNFLKSANAHKLQFINFVLWAFWCVFRAQPCLVGFDVCQVLMKFVDFGDCAVIDVQNIRLLPARFQQLPRLAVNVKLKGASASEICLADISSCFAKQNAEKLFYLLLAYYALIMWTSYITNNYVNIGPLLLVMVAV